LESAVGGSQSAAIRASVTHFLIGAVPPLTAD